ncbi:MAG TPA: hypothetical protein VF912_09765 [Anaeromyxobacter sp.]
MADFLEALRTRLGEALQTWGPWTRWTWCRAQRRRLRRPGGGIVWVRGSAAVTWAEWGARRGYFDVQYMDGLPYLCALAAPVV